MKRAPSRYPGGAAQIEAVADALEAVVIDYFPWRGPVIGSADPWMTVLAEMMLQRTRAEQVLPVFEAVLKRWPTPERMAGARLVELERLLRPLGLHVTRAKRLVRIARAMSKGTAAFDLPNTDDNEPTGVGTYTHRAIGSFAYGASVGIVDANVMRVLGRAFGLRERTEARVQDLADRIAVLDGSPAHRNYAMLDVGRKFCKPAPRCGECPLRNVCRTAARRRPS